jgi:2-polyprenyl-6-methoxyphenol hydroxylase-like FAD-dependent oxidoreductase
VAQFRQPHNVFPRFRHLCDEDLPGVNDELAAAGFRALNLLDAAPPSLSDRAPRPGDARLEMLTGRRPVLEAVLAAHAEEQPGVTVHRGVRVAGLTAGSSAIPGVPHVDGVVTADGERWSADLVVDAMGRRTPSDGWLADLGTRPPRRVDADSGYAYYTRYYRGPLPEWRTRAVTPHGTVTVLTLPSDNDTWSVTVFCGSRDEPLKALRDPACFDRVVRGFPLQQHWLDAEVEPGVAVIAGVLDRIRSLVVDDQPIVTGFTTVGDAWACTNPSGGRGISVGLMHAHLLRDVLVEHAAAPAEFAREFPARAQVEVAPYVDHQLRVDRVRVAEMDALRRGVPAPPRDPGQAAFLAAAMEDPVVFRALMETLLCLALPEEVLARPHVAAAVDARWGRVPDPPPGPDRRELLALVAG